MRHFATFIILIFCVGPLAAQQVHVPVIPNLVGQDETNAQISVTVDRGLRSSKRLPTAALRTARTALHDGQAIHASDLRALANAGDGLAAQRYVRLLQAARQSADPSDLAYYSSIAVGTGRIWTLGTMIDAMHKLNPQTEPKARINQYIKVLYPHAWAGNSRALQAVLTFNGEGRLFGPLSDATRDRILAEAREHGDGRLELGMAMGLLEQTRAADRADRNDLIQARNLLELAQRSDHLAVSTTAQNLLRLVDWDQINNG
ncbi:hypothetical protein [Planktotalea sp.]|uniref:hypothetical protein n=1 Tax=Planktotalea sp. TaxID=2029877 RepID=UPI00329A5824